MKKVIYSIFSILMVIIVCFCSVLNLTLSENNDNRKIMLSDSIMRTGKEPTVENILKTADNVIRGKITNIDFIDVELRTGTAWDDKMIASGGLPIERYTEYTVKVTDTIVGNLEKDDVIKYYILGDLNTSVTKPKGSKEICIFTKKSGDIYNTISYENSIFEIDEKGKVYSFSNVDEFSKFDNMSYETFKTKIQQKYIPILRAKMYDQIQVDNMVTK